MQVNSAQPGGPRPGYIRSGLQDVELGPKSGAEISLRDLERFVGVLDIAGLGLQDAIGLPEIEKGAAHIGGDGKFRRFQGMARRVAPAAPRLPAAPGREAIEDVPGRVEPDDETMIEFRPDCRITLAV